MMRASAGPGRPNAPLFEAAWLLMTACYAAAWIVGASAGAVAGAGLATGAVVIDVVLIASLKMALGLAGCLRLRPADVSTGGMHRSAARAWTLPPMLATMARGTVATLMGPCGILLINAISTIALLIVAERAALRAPHALLGKVLKSVFFS